MEKVFRFSKIASLIVLLMAVIQVVFRNRLIFIATQSLFQILMLVFFLLILKNSVKGSVLRCPTIIGAISAFVGIIAILFPGDGIIFTYISVIGLCVSFIWVAKYLKNLPKVFAWLCAIVPIIITIFLGNHLSFRLYHLFYYGGDYYQFLNIVSAITNVLKYAVFAAFYYTFSKTLTK